MSYPPTGPFLSARTRHVWKETADVKALLSMCHGTLLQDSSLAVQATAFPLFRQLAVAGGREENLSFCRQKTAMEVSYLPFSYSSAVLTQTIQLPLLEHSGEEVATAECLWRSLRHDSEQIS